jgi:hypothetical protein
MAPILHLPIIKRSGTFWLEKNTRVSFNTSCQMSLTTGTRKLSKLTRPTSPNQIQSAALCYMCRKAEGRVMINLSYIATTFRRILLQHYCRRRILDTTQISVQLAGVWTMILQPLPWQNAVSFRRRGLIRQATVSILMSLGLVTDKVTLTQGLFLSFSVSRTINTAPCSTFRYH